tara:strand:- start:1008 stop:1364 length:357 start_codon:yes stop_codon:yes gene_type:complete
MSSIEMTDKLISEALNPDTPSFFVAEYFTDFKYLIKLHGNFGAANKHIFHDTKAYDTFFISGSTEWFDEQIEPWLFEENSGPVEQLELNPTHSFFHAKLPRFLVRFEPDIVEILKDGD